jgi:hypothetical protein
MTEGIPPDAPIFRGIVCTDCGHICDAVRLKVAFAENGGLDFRCPQCLSDQIDWVLNEPKTGSMEPNSSDR